jgi:thiol-disulfide isomerase/thioredoxin
MQRIIILIMTLCIFQRISSQLVRPLKIGDSIPEFEFTSFYDSNKVSLKNLKGKFIILDFWNKSCLACISSMPKMDSLQRMFEGLLQVIYITKNSREEVKELFLKIKLQKPRVPFVVNDRIFYDSLFPHIGDPLHAWIDKTGIITAITSGYNATFEHVKAFVEGKIVNLSTRRELDDFDATSSFLHEGASRLNKYLNYHSVLFHGLSEETSKNFILQVRDPVSGRMNAIRAVNATAYSLFNLAYARRLFGVDINIINLPNNNRIFIESRHAEKFQFPTDNNLIDQWMYDNTFSYELSIPPERSKELFDFMQMDMERYLPFKARVEKRKVMCLVLVKTGKDDLPLTKFDEKSNSKSREVFIVKNATIQSSLYPALIYANQNLKTPIIDKTGYNKPVNIQLNCSLDDIPSLNMELKKYGLSLELKINQIDILLISDK